MVRRGTHYAPRVTPLSYGSRTAAVQPDTRVQNPHAHCRALRETSVKKLTALILLAFASSFAYAADSACMASAKQKKLAGAAQQSFVKKCETDAKAKCEAAAAEKKLAGAAKASNIKKCVRETGPAA